MRAISIKQPWATLIVAGIKPVENRSWPIRHRGPLLIHAGKRIDWEGFERIDQLGLDLPDPDVLHRGGIIGQVDVVGCVSDSRSPWASRDRWHWIVANPRPLPFEPMPGRLGLFNVGDDDQLQLELKAA